MYIFLDLDKHIQNNIDKKAFGASVSIAIGDEVIFHKNYGYTSSSKQFPITDESVFRLASNTKVITAVAVVLCQQLGLLNIDDYIDKYLPEFKDFRIEDEQGKLSQETYRITISQILDHTSGFAMGSFEERLINGLKPEDRKDLKTAVSHYSVCPLLFKPGTSRMYSAIVGFDCLARIVEIVSGEPYFDFLKKNVLKPLEMNNTKYCYDGVELKNKVISSNLENGKLVDFDDKNATFDSFPYNYTGGGAGLISTVEDYMHLAMMLTNGGVYKGKRFFTPEIYKVFTRTRRIDHPNGCVQYWCCGCYVRHAGEKMLPEGSFGWSGAYGTHYWSDPKNKISVVYMHNSVIFGYGGSGAEHTRTLEDDVVKAMNLKYE